MSIRDSSRVARSRLLCTRDVTTANTSRTQVYMTLVFFPMLMSMPPSAVFLLCLLRLVFSEGIPTSSSTGFSASRTFFHQIEDWLLHDLLVATPLDGLSISTSFHMEYDSGNSTTSSPLSPACPLILNLTASSLAGIPKFIQSLTRGDLGGASQVLSHLTELSQSLSTLTGVPSELGGGSGAGVQAYCVDAQGGKRAVAVAGGGSGAGVLGGGGGGGVQLPLCEGAHWGGGSGWQWDAVTVERRLAGDAEAEAGVRWRRFRDCWRKTVELVAGDQCASVEVNGGGGGGGDGTAESAQCKVGFGFGFSILVTRNANNKM